MKKLGSFEKKQVSSTIKSSIDGDIYEIIYPRVGFNYIHVWYVGLPISFTVETLASFYLKQNIVIETN